MRNNGRRRGWVILAALYLLSVAFSTHGTGQEKFVVPAPPASARGSARQVVTTEYVPSESNALVHVSEHPESHASDHASDHAWERGHFYLDADFLLVRPRRRAQDFAIIDPVANARPEGVVQSMNWDTRPAVRFGAGYVLGGHEWEIGGDYTYIHSSTREDAFAPAGGTLYATQAHPLNVEEVLSAQGRSSLDYDVIDFTLSRHFHPSENFAVTISGGGRFAAIDQISRVQYNGGDANNAIVANSILFDGGGLRFGAKGVVQLGGGLNLFGKAYTSLLVGDYKARLNETNAGVTNVSVVDKYTQTVNVNELGFGLGWRRRNVQLSIGYELTNWINFVDSPDFTDDVHEGKYLRRLSDLTLDGLAVELLFEY